MKEFPDLIPILIIVNLITAFVYGLIYAGWSIK
jgi:hypothetical protein